MSKTKSQKFLMRTRKSDLSFEEHYVYSVLAYRTKFNKPASQKALAKLTNLERGKTVSKSMKRLESLGLAKKQGRRWIAIEPQGEARTWFFWKKGEIKNWFDSFSFHRINRVNPECSIKLTPRENVYYCLWKKDSDNPKHKFRDKPNSYMAAAVGCTTKTISRIKNRINSKIEAANSAGINFWHFGVVHKVQPAPAPVKTLSIAERVKAEGERMAAKMEADRKALVAQAEAEFFSDHFVEPKEIESLIDSESVEPSVQKQIENESKPKLYNGWPDSGGMDEPEMTPEEENEFYADWWYQEINQRLTPLFSKMLKWDDYMEILEIINHRGHDFRYEWVMMGRLETEAKEIWDRSKREAKSNPQKYFKVSLINRLNQSYGVGAA